MIRIASAMPIHLWMLSQRPRRRMVVDWATWLSRDSGGTLNAIASRLQLLSAVRPTAEQIVIDAGEAEHLLVGVAALGGDRLDRLVEVEQDRAGPVVADHRLDPE